jgi:hypothetical protein
MPPLVDLLYYAAPLVLTVIANRYGIKLPGQPNVIVPTPGTAPDAPPAPAPAGNPLSDVLMLLLSWKAGLRQLDEPAKEKLRALKSLLSDAEVK